MPKKFNHAFTIAFEVKTNSKADDVSSYAILSALDARLQNLRNADIREVQEAVGLPFDTFTYDEEVETLDEFEHLAAYQM